MLGYRGPRHRREVLGDLARGPLAVSDQPQDGAPRRIGDRPQRVVHRSPLVHCFLHCFLHKVAQVGKCKQYLTQIGDAVTVMKVGTRDEWLRERVDLLKEEKALNRQRDALAERRRALPWVPIETEYVFDGADGEATLAELFGDQSQLLVYHFMFGPGWGEGCPSCSFIADCIDGTGVHLAHRDVRLVCVGHAPYGELAAYRERMGWTTPFFSSSRSDFNHDFHVSFTPEEQANGAEYNFTRHPHPEEELPGISAFAKTDDGRVFHTYSSYERGLDPLMSVYQLLDLTPKGRDEKDLPFPAAWLRRHDAYED